MPRRKPKKAKTKPRAVRKQISKPEDLDAFIREASEVRQLTQHPGWAVIERDLTEYRNGLVRRLAYLDPKKPESREARILFIAVDKVFTIVGDYEENRRKAIELMEKIDNPDLAVTMDVDNG